LGSESVARGGQCEYRGRTWLVGPSPGVVTGRSGSLTFVSPSPGVVRVSQRDQLLGSTLDYFA
jgi:hypothetical protein